MTLRGWVEIERDGIPTSILTASVSERTPAPKVRSLTLAVRMLGD